MTSDAKIGLLLGLVFIIITAFLINGLPVLLGKNGSGQIIRTTVASVNTDYSIDAQAEKAMRTFAKDVPDIQLVPERVVSPVNDPRFAASSSATGNQLKTFGSTKANNEKKYTSAENRFSKTKTYMVMPGDNLGKIAVKVYGKQIGNTREAVTRIYKANKKLLNSPDDLLIGQQLIVPDLSSPEITMKQSPESSNSSKAPRSVIQRAKQVFLNAVSRKEPPRCVVREGDSLWSIAKRELGDGDRYYEILDMNRDIINNANDIYSGQTLKLPSH